MKNLKFYRTLKSKQAAITLALALSSTSLVGCGETEFIEDIGTSYDVIDTNAGEDLQIAPQTLNVPNENFKLSVSYSTIGDEENKWRITGDKDLYITVKTEGLPSGTKCWIDNIHIDTFIVATKPAFNNIKQDSMDDRIHNSLMMGFPISDETTYSSINLIEGQDKDFIEGTYYAYCSSSGALSNADVVQRRYTDVDYLQSGVYANKVSIVYGLLVQYPNEEEPHGVDVASTIGISVYDKIKKVDGNVVNVYQYDKFGNATLIETYTINSTEMIEKETGKTLTLD